MDVNAAISKCPFLHGLALKEGHAYASSIAINPIIPDSSTRRPILEEEQDFASTFRLFHGPGGIVPLKNQLVNEAINPKPVGARETTDPPQLHRILSNAPLAVLSLGMPDFGDFFKKLQSVREGHSQPSRRIPSQGRGDLNKPSASSSGSTLSSNPPSISSHSNAASPSGGTCPLRKILGPSLSGIVFNSVGHLQCPAPIIHARAILAGTQPVRALRPQALPVKLLAVGAFTAALNVPCGMWREHTEKFSWQWIVAVHASIPFVAMLRKAVVMPKIAIACTIAMAIAGQAIGARMERERLLQLQAEATYLRHDAAAIAEHVADAASLTQLQASAHKAAKINIKKAKVVVRSKGKALSTGLRRSVDSKLGSGNISPSYASNRTALLLEDSVWRMEKEVGMHSFKQLLALPPSVCVR
ncbi:hypothetical protein CEUSTIGMA_g10660.t1 [Chlamydomonas eustigma]|uniref:Uncharacterized protein n=1 Tax=Chlamydomonas eustigma TaxID=1157962 RepID=A0A250XJI4_9CHLO|nr:hypothetical protein CEUSTIGMA_g10660.t1 [Chlamydomonas eustigma]|eukprot:GAX83234.1 hypothetical protein CEUSTIGMA_g10660.t1 [Chlamydomonas eustigma]